MWFVVQTADGMETAAIEKCRIAIPVSIADKIFSPTYECMRRYLGAWHKKQKTLFPGYIFIESDSPRELEEKLECITGVVNPVKVGGGFHPIRNDEENILREMMDESFCIRYSLGYIVDDKLVVEKGPLFGKASSVKKIDRHRRIAEVVISLFDKEKQIEVGLEVPARLTADEYEQMKTTA